MSTIDVEPVRMGVQDDLVGYHLRRASGIFAAEVARAVVGTGVRPVLVDILSIVVADPGIRQGNAARALGIQRGNMVSLVDELVEAGLVKRQAVVEDRRVFALKSTAAGRRVLDGCMCRIRAAESRLLLDLSSEDQATLTMLLGRMGCAVNEKGRAQRDIRYGSSVIPKQRATGDLRPPGTNSPSGTIVTSGRP